MNKNVAIIGGGICGLYLALKLSEARNRVTVFEKKREIGEEVCSGLFSERILKFIPESEKLIENKIDFCLVHFPGKTIKLSFSKRFFVMSHFKLDRLTAALAEKSGAEIILGRNILSIPEGFDRVIGTDGSFSAVRKHLNLPRLNYRLGLQAFSSEKNSDNFVETWPCEDGFLWKIPRGGETEYGIMTKPRLARQIFDDFFRKSGMNFANIKAKIIPQGLQIPNHSSITLCGNAAGITKPWSGGGVAWGLTAANMLAGSFPDFLKYRKKMKRFFAPRIIFSKAATKAAYFAGYKTPWIIPKNAKIESDFLL